MSTRVGLSALVALLALEVVGGTTATRAAPTVPRAAIVSLDLRTHRQQTYPINDLDALAPDGRRVAFVTRRGNEEFQLRTSALDGSGNRVLFRSPFPGFLAWPRWAPNGSEIAFLGPSGLSLIPAGGGTPRTLSDNTDAAAWAPDSQRLAFPGELAPSGSARLTVQNEDGSGRRALGERRPIHSLSWSADGKRLLYSTNAPWETERDTGRIYAVNAATGADAIIARGVDPAWSHDGKLLSFVRRVKGRMTLYLLAHGRRRAALRGGYGFTFAHAWSRRGHRLAFAATNRFGQFRIYLYDADGSAQPRPLTGLHYGPVVELVWSPNGRKLLFERTAG